MKILVFAGAGASVELGVPGMAALAEDFVQHVRQHNVHPEIVDRLTESERDLERLIEKIDQICDARHSLDSLDVDMSGLGAQVATIRREVEWYVQHVAERITTWDAQLMWGPILRCTNAHQIVFVTTNYDRAIEIAANAEDVSLDDGFVSTVGGEASRWTGFEPSNRRVMLIKLHGSTNWYRDRPTERAFKLRHPMALFADGTLVFGNRKLGAALVLPSREKILTREPYPRLSHAFLGAGDNAELILFVGSSLRDPHIRKAAEAWAESKPVFVVNPDSEFGAVGGAKVMRETASEFLISTLPNALEASDPLASLGSCGVDDGGTLTAWRSDGILQVVRKALDGRIGTRSRCVAVGQLVEWGATLPVKWVQDLISGDDPALARHALGLILGSSGQHQLMRMAEESPHQGDSTFRDEYDMLQEVMASEEAIRQGAQATGR